jgi:hypothetical protein
MVKLNTSQAGHLEKIKAAKAKYDREISLLELDLKRQKDLLKNPIRELVADARDMEIPVRQIHQTGLGFAQVNSMVTFLSDRTEGLAATLDRVTSRVNGSDSPNGGGNSGSDSRTNSPVGSVREPAAIKLIDHGRGIWSVFDRVGDEWKFTFSGVHNGGPHIMFNGHEAFELSEDGPEIRQAILDKFPTMANVDKEYQTNK